MNIDKLKSVIQEANPEIMELKFGCEVELRFGDFAGETGFVITQCSVCKKHKKVSSCNEYCEFDDAAEIIQYPDDIYREWTLLNDSNQFRILGRPIRLADVLLAIPNKSIVVTADGLFGSFDGIDSGVEYPQIEWNLKDDNLDNQSEECKEFLTNLLCQEEKK